MKFLHYLFAAGAVCACACTAVPSPTGPSAVASAAPAAAYYTTSVASITDEDFEPSFYQAFLQNAFESPNRLEPVRLLRGPLRIYLRTVDNAGRAVDDVTLDTTERTLIETAEIWSGQTFGIVEVLRGRATREKRAGWITVKWSGTAMAGRCGRSTVGVDGGYMELDASGACSCGLETRVYPRLVRHELGHAMGYYHTDDAHDVMSSLPVPRDRCDALPSDRERRHAEFAHR